MDKKENIEATQEVGNNVVELKEKRDKTTSYLHVFKKPFNWEGKDHKEIDFNFGGLTGNKVFFKSIGSIGFRYIIS